MPNEHEVRQGECISSIADKYGFFPDAIWNDSANAELKEKRKDPNVLYPGDVVVIPDKRLKEETGATETRHRFRKKNTPAVLRIQLLDADDNPRAGVNYTLDIDGDLISGTTDGEGKLEHSIPSGARTGNLIPENEDAIPLELGALDPIDTIAGVKERLLNLGYDCGESNNQWDAQCEEAVKEFQKEYKLTESGQIDQATKNKLQDIHGS